MKQLTNNQTLLKPTIVIAMQSVLLFTIFYILSSDQEMTNLEEIQLTLSAVLIVVGSFITFKSLRTTKESLKIRESTF